VSYYSDLSYRLRSGNQLIQAISNSVLREYDLRLDLECRRTQLSPNFLQNTADNQHLILKTAQLRAMLNKAHCLKREPAFPFYRAYGLDANSNGTDKSVNILLAKSNGVFRA
jgi:hypothetical protein